MELVFRLFDADEEGGFRVAQHGQVCEHLHGSVRGEFCRYRLFKRGVFHLKEESAIREKDRIDLFEAGDPLRKSGQYCVEGIWVLLLEVLNHVWQVVAGRREMLLRPGLGQPSRRICAQVREIPSCDKSTEGADTGMLCKLAERIDSQNLR